MSASRHTTALLRRIAGPALVASVVGTLAVTLAPFRFGVPVDLTEGGPGAFWLRLVLGYSQPDDVLNNVMLFLPLGATLAAYLWARGLGALRRLGLVTVLAAGLALAIETGQLFLPSRTAALTDVGANTAGAVLGALCIWLVGHWATSVRTLGAGMAIYVLIVVAAAAQLQSAADLDSWNPEYHLLVGNEGNGRRAWSGTVSDVRAAAAGLSAAEAGRLLRDEPVPGFEAALVFDYPLRGSLRDRAGRAPALEWRPGRESNVRPPQSAGGVTTGPGAFLRSVAPMTAAVGAARTTNRFTLAATITPASIEQGGPARIISLSHNNSLRNLTIGQEGADLVVRLRTASNGQNGTRQVLRARDFLAAGEPRRIVVTYGSARLALYADGVGEAAAVEVLPEAAALRWLSPGDLRQVLDELPSRVLVVGGWLLVHGLTGLTVGATLAWSAALAGAPRAAPLAWWLALMGAGVMPALIEFTVAAVGGRESRMANIALGITLATSVLLFLGRRSASPTRRW